MLVHPLSRSALILISEFAKGLKIIKKLLIILEGRERTSLNVLKKAVFI